MPGDGPLGPGAAFNRIDAIAATISSHVNATSNGESLFQARSGSQSGIKQPESRQETFRKCAKRAEGLMGTAGVPPRISLNTFHALAGSCAPLAASYDERHTLSYYHLFHLNNDLYGSKILGKLNTEDGVCNLTLKRRCFLNQANLRGFKGD
jgi:hypothetical protein